MMMRSILKQAQAFPHRFALDYHSPDQRPFQIKDMIPSDRNWLEPGSAELNRQIRRHPAVF